MIDSKPTPPAASEPRYGNDGPSDFDESELPPRPDDDMTAEQVLAAGESVTEENPDFYEDKPGLRELEEAKLTEALNFIAKA